MSAGVVTNKRVIAAMKAVDRRDFCYRCPYEDSPQTIGFNATISAPHMHAFALSKLEPYLQPGMSALDIGSGSGYLTACMASMVGSEGKVVGVEHISELVDASIRHVSMHHPEWIENSRIMFRVGDGRLGYKNGGPYDCIHVGAAASETPQALIDQLKRPGRIFIPVGRDAQSIMVYDKDAEGDIHMEKWMNVLYVPLTDEFKQRNYC